MEIYVDKDSKVVKGYLNNEITSLHPLVKNCDIFTEDKFPYYWGIGWYQYIDNQYILTELGQKNIQKLYNVPIDIHYTEYIPHIINKKIQILWNAATKYQNDRLDPNGLIGMSFKALQTGTTTSKAYANVAWVKSIWTEYQRRKDEVKDNPNISINIDYSVCGELPYSYFEAEAE